MTAGQTIVVASVVEAAIMTAVATIAVATLPEHRRHSQATAVGHLPGARLHPLQDMVPVVAMVAIHVRGTRGHEMQVDMVVQRLQHHAAVDTVPHHRRPRKVQSVAMCQAIRSHHRHPQSIQGVTQEDLLLLVAPMAVREVATAGGNWDGRNSGPSLVCALGQVKRGGRLR